MEEIWLRINGGLEQSSRTRLFDTGRAHHLQEHDGLIPISACEPGDRRPRFSSASSTRPRPRVPLDWWSFTAQSHVDSQCAG